MNRFRRRVHFGFLDIDTSRGMILDHNHSGSGSAEHKGFSFLAWIILAIVLILVITIVRGASSASSI